MSILTNIDGVPLFSTLAEALAFATANGLSGYHTHVYNGQLGYMGGATHVEATMVEDTTAEFLEENPVTVVNTSSSNSTTSGSSSY